jgi:hypothetical protein
MLNSLSKRVSLINKEFLLILDSASENIRINKNDDGGIYLVNFNILYKEREPVTLIYKYIKYHDMFLYCLFSFIVESSKNHNIPPFVLSNYTLFVWDKYFFNMIENKKKELIIDYNDNYEFKYNSLSNIQNAYSTMQYYS